VGVALGAAVSNVWLLCVTVGVVGGYPVITLPNINTNTNTYFELIKCIENSS